MIINFHSLPHFLTNSLHCGRDWSGSPVKQHLMFFVGWRRLTKEAPVQLTKTQVVQAGYNGKPARRPNHS